MPDRGRPVGPWVAVRTAEAWGAVYVLDAHVYPNPNFSTPPTLRWPLRWNVDGHGLHWWWQWTGDDATDADQDLGLSQPLDPHDVQPDRVIQVIHEDDLLRRDYVYQRPTVDDGQQHDVALELRHSTAVDPFKWLGVLCQAVRKLQGVRILSVPFLYPNAEVLERTVVQRLVLDNGVYGCHVDGLNQPAERLVLRDLLGGHTATVQLRQLPRQSQPWWPALGRGPSLEERIEENAAAVRAWHAPLDAFVREGLLAEVGDSTYTPACKNPEACRYQPDAIVALQNAAWAPCGDAPSLYVDLRTHGWDYNRRHLLASRLLHECLLQRQPFCGRKRAWPADNDDENAAGEWLTFYVTWKYHRPHGRGGVGGHATLLSYHPGRRVFRFFDPNGTGFDYARPSRRERHYLRTTHALVADAIDHWQRSNANNPSSGPRLEATPYCFVNFQAAFEQCRGEACPPNLAPCPAGCCTMVTHLVYACGRRFGYHDPHRLALALAGWLLQLPAGEFDATRARLLAWQNHTLRLAALDGGEGGMNIDQQHARRLERLRQHIGLVRRTGDWPTTAHDVCGAVLDAEEDVRVGESNRDTLTFCQQPPADNPTGIVWCVKHVKQFGLRWQRADDAPPMPLVDDGRVHRVPGSDALSIAHRFGVGVPSAWLTGWATRVEVLHAAFGQPVRDCQAADDEKPNSTIGFFVVGSLRHGKIYEYVQLRVKQVQETTTAKVRVEWWTQTIEITEQLQRSGWVVIDWINNHHQPCEQNFRPWPGVDIMVTFEEIEQHYLVRQDDDKGVLFLEFVDNYGQPRAPPKKKETPPPQR